MALPRPSLPSVRALLHRPAVVLPTTALALAGLLGTGLLVANAVDAPETAPVSAPTSPAPTQDAPVAAADDGGTVGTADAAATTSGGDDNVAVAVNTRDGSTVYAVRLKVVMTGADVVDSGNAAVAVASCADCQTVAIALEGVIVTGDAEVVAPENIALAINSGCSGCQTLAYAYQNLQTADGRVRLSGDGRRSIALLRQQLNGLRRSGLDILSVEQEVDRIAGEFAAVLTSEVIPLSPTTTGRPTQDAATVQSPSPSPSQVASAEPTSEPQPSSPTPATDQPPSAQPSPSDQSPSDQPSPRPTSPATPSGG